MINLPALHNLAWFDIYQYYICTYYISTELLGVYMIVKVGDALLDLIRELRGAKPCVAETRPTKNVCFQGSYLLSSRNKTHLQCQRTLSAQLDPAAANYSHWFGKCDPCVTAASESWIPPMRGWNLFWEPLLQKYAVFTTTSFRDNERI